MTKAFYEAVEAYFGGMRYNVFMKHTVTALALGIATAVIIGYTFVSLLGFEKRVREEMPMADMRVGTTTQETASSSVADGPLETLASFVVGKVSYTPYGDGLVYTGSTELEVEVRPFLVEKMKLSLVSGSEYGSPKSELDGGKVWLNREKGEIYFVSSDGEKGFLAGEPYSNRLLFTLHQKDGADDIGAALRKIRLVGADSKTTSDVWQYCTVAKNEEVKDKEVYWLVENDQYQMLPESERVEMGPMLCGVNRYFVFQDVVFESHRYADGVQVDDVSVVR